jgi:hypothetical protein
MRCATKEVKTFGLKKHQKSNIAAFEMDGKCDNSGE